MVNPEKYRHMVFPQVVAWRKRRPDEPMREAITHLALVTGCPIIAICQFIGELEGFSPELNQTLARLKEFYGDKE